MKMKYIIHLALAILMLIPPLNATAIGVINHSAAYTAQYSSAKLTIGSDTLAGATYSTVSYDGMYNSGAPGMPSLPVDYLKFSVPYNATNFTVTATIRTWHNQNLDHLVYPCQVPMCTDYSDTLVITLPDSSAYFSGAYYPTQVAWIAAEGFLAGENHVVTVAVQPFRYQHTSMTDLLSLARTCNITLRYELSDSLALQPIVRNDSALREEGYQLTQSLVVNPGNVKSNAPAQTFAVNDSLIFVQGGLAGGDVLNGGGNSLPGDTIVLDTIGHSYIKYPYLIVTTSELKHAVRRIAALKRQKGYNVKVVTLEDVYSSIHSGNGDVVGEGKHAHLTLTDDVGKLRQFLRSYYKLFGTKYVFLVGDSVPYRSIEFAYNGSYFPNLPTDLYLSDLNTDWSNLNITIQFDFEPDLFVGRLFVSDSQEISNYCDKLFCYEINPGKGDNAYLKSIFYSEAYDMQQDSEVEFVNDEYANIFNDSTHYKESIGLHFPSGTDIINKLNEKNFGYLSIFNHGSPSGWITYGERREVNDEVYYYLWAIDSIHLTYNNTIYNLDNHTGNGINNLRNKYYPNIIYSSSCTTMPFDRAPGYGAVMTNIGKAFTTGKDFGGPAFLGNTRSGFTGKTSSGLEKEFAKQLSVGNSKMGEAEALSKSEFYIRYINLVHNLLGDPEFEIWTEIPNRFPEINVERINNRLILSGVSSCPAIVAYHTTDNKPSHKVISTSRDTIDDVSLNKPIMIYKHNYLPLIFPLELQNETINESQYIVCFDLIAGNAIDNHRSNGDVVITSGVEYEIEASGTVRLEDGFKVERGATLGVYPSSF